MNLRLIISLATNAILVLLVFWLIHARPSPVKPSPAVAEITVQSPSPAQPMPASPAKTPMAPASTGFRWEQLDAADYHLYVRNLRAIGCPEATLRAIVTADVHAAYGIQYDDLGKKLTDLASGSWSAQAGAFNTQAALKARLQNLPAEEDAMIADLLGLKPSPVADLAVAAPPTHVNHPSLNHPVSLPLILQPLDLEQLNLTGVQKQVLEMLRQEFQSEVGGPDQDPNDPAYLARWQQAQPKIDQMLRGELGSQFYLKLQLLAAGQTPPP